MNDVLTGSGAGFWACVLAASIYGAVKIVRIWRNASKHPPQASTPAAGSSPVPGQDGRPPASAPAPDITPHEAAFLATIGRLRQIAQPGQVLAGREIADGLRVRVPGVDDWTLGVITLDLLGYIKAMAFGLPDAEHAIQCAMDAFGLCAEELTRLTRNGEVPR